MNEGPSIGQVLRQGREERGLSVEQAAFQSKVPLRLLQALESDDYHLLPDPMYLIRFLREYARLLKLDPAALEAEFQEATRRPPKASLAVVAPPPPPPAIPWRQVAWTAAAILVITPLVFIALSLNTRRAPETPPPAPPPERTAEENTTADGGGAAMPDRLAAARPDAAPPGESPVGGGPERLATSPGAFPGASTAPAGQARPATRDRLAPGGGPVLGHLAPEGQPGAGRLVLLVRATEPAWLSVRSDTQGRQQVLLQAGQSARFVADRGFRVTLGNVGGVLLSLNGSPLAVRGRSGEVIRDLEIPLVRAEAKPVPTEPAGAGR